MDVSLHNDGRCWAEKLSPKPGDVLVIRYSSHLLIEEVEERAMNLRDDLIESGHDGVQVMLLPEYLSLDKVSEERMEELGWQRKKDQRGYRWL